MAEETGELWRHIGELHRKHSDLAIQMHEAKHAKTGDKGGDELSTVAKELVSTMKELIAVMRQDVKADKEVAGAGGERS